VTEHPQQAVALSMRHVAGAGAGAFEVTVKNVGKEPVALPDLATLGLTAGDHDRRLGVRVAHYPESKPGVTDPPLSWVHLPLAGPRGDGKPLILAPGAEVVKLTAPWVPAARGRHLVQAVFASYGAAPVVEGKPAIRGRALSEAVEVVGR
jgi:hypothetical protein